MALLDLRPGRLAALSGFDPELHGKAALDFAQRTGVAGLVADRLLAGAVGRLPEAVRRGAVASRLRIEAQVQQYATGLNPVFEQLADRQIPVVLLKGAALVGRVYPSGARRLGDVDALIRRVDYPEVARALIAEGFELVLDGATEAEMLRDSHQMSFVRPVPGGHLHVDLHWALTHPRGQPFHLSASDFLARARLARGPLGPALAARPEDIFVHLATQIVGDGGRFDLPRIVDLVHLIEGGLDWPDLLRAADRGQARTAVYIAVCLAETLGASIPSTAQADLRRSVGRPARALAALLADDEVLCGQLRLRRGTSVALLPLCHDRKRVGLARLLRLTLRRDDALYDLQLDRDAGEPSGGHEAAERARVLSAAAVSGSLLLLGPRVVGHRWRTWLMQTPPDESRPSPT